MTVGNGRRNLVEIGAIVFEMIIEAESAKMMSRLCEFVQHILNGRDDAHDRAHDRAA